MSLRDNLLTDAVRSLRVLKPVIVDTDCSVAGGIEAMHKQGGGCVVITVDGKPAGVFTERDVLTKVLVKSISLETPIVDVMTSPVKVIRAGCSFLSSTCAAPCSSPGTFVARAWPGLICWTCLENSPATI